MGAFWCLPFAVLLHRAMCSGHGAATEVNGAVGKSVTFRLQSLLEGEVVWISRNYVMAQVRLGNPPKVTFYNQNYSSRLSFSDNGTAATISRLAMEDAGIYEAIPFTAAKSFFSLHVYAELPQPAVTCTWHNCSGAVCRYELRCAVPAPEAGVSYAWSDSAGLRHNSTALSLERLPGREPPVTCTARNPVSRSNVTVEPAAVCTETSAGSRAAAISVAVALVVVLLFALGIARARGERLRGAAADGLTVYAQVGSLQQPSPQGPAQNSSNAEKTDPKATPAAGRETAQTIYSTVQATAQPQTDDEKIRNGGPEQGKKSAGTMTAPGGFRGWL
ncbi:SLAM family member 5-like [Apteryx mantelli]|uniref:SLAM family member 5-like n=1 Tax=Apteryx mantelli TaxID=2696672 RepID=A0ABM4FWA8_9AVES